VDPKEDDCRLQKGVPPCKSGMAQEEHLQDNSDPGKLRTTNRKRYDQDNVVRETWIGRKFGKRRWKGPECNNGIMNRGLKEQLRGSKRIKDLSGRLPLCPSKDRTAKNGIGRWSSGQ
jgi:hypothetical protein